ncbi:putative glycosyltransferase At5g11130 [Bidens hawaiensis]|uniref:putative glycosyltransferase At5g11130 n=1 Tax=Bidens hawaiensis TaxID=980011 RepID=UPI00404A4F9C
MATDGWKTGYKSPLFYTTIFLILFFVCLNTQFNFFTFSSIKPYFITPVPASPPLPSITNKENTVEERLSRARAAIREAGRMRIYNMPWRFLDRSFIPRGDVYRNPYAFYQSHIEMEKSFKIWAYKEGELPIFHGGPMNNIYSSEGQIMDEIESRNSRFFTQNPNEAHVFFIPVSVVAIRHYLYRSHGDYDRRIIQDVVTDYIGVISNKYPYWNRSSGADHFFASCHDWAPDVSATNPKLYEHFIRVLCNANSSEGFRPERDVTLPELSIPYNHLGPPLTGLPPENRSILAFFAGGNHGHVRKYLFETWLDKDQELKVFTYLPKTLNYTELLGRSKFCLCPSGYEVASPRIVEAISAGCVPVIVSDHYVLPFSDVLDWSKFSVHVPVGKIPDIKRVLEGIEMDDYLKMQKMVMKVQRHFIIHRPSRPYDLIDMVLHSVWLRRLNVKLSSF